ncbi:MAG: SgcJ/EcaC family oxidoreductase [Gammaproteobacteria bacterium]|nr:SgcJ/EcaC family oxidoreductase [Gammaproteobacteria bacterium]
MIEPRPEIVHEQFLRRFRERDLEGLLELYEDEATFVTADGDATSGKTYLREFFADLLALDVELELETRYAARCGDIALLSNAWRLTGTDADGQPLERSGQTTEVARRQPNGRWLLIVDHPWGGQ